MADTLDSRLAVRLRLKEDFKYYAAHCLKIRTKEGSVTPFVLNKSQEYALDKLLEQWLETGRIRAVVLKGRQQGFSTMIAGFYYWLTTHRRGFKTFILAHEAEATKTLFDMTRRYHENVPEIVKPSSKYASRHELVFGNLDSGYRTATAGGDSAGRSETIQALHASEQAFWPGNSARDIWTGLVQTVPNMDNTFVIIESTANGMGNLFHDMWNGAQSGASDYIPIFSPWYWSEEYRREAPATFEPSPEEEKLIEKFGLDHDQLQFRRFRIAEAGYDSFLQEYPSEAEEAFIASGRPVFDPVHLRHYKDSTAPPVATKEIEGETFVNHTRGSLHLYKDIDDDMNYTIGVDVSSGIAGGDYSCCQVIDNNRNLVARWRGHLYPDALGDFVYHLAQFFNDAFVVVESNAHGILTVNTLHKIHGYQNVYTEKVRDKMTDTETVKLGFQTNVKTKTQVIDCLRSHIRDHEIEIPDRLTLDEMSTYAIDAKGSYNAEAGCYDDTVMALALALFNHQPYFKPYITQDTDYAYIA